MATNFVRASYTEVIDLQTKNGQIGLVGIHTPTGITPYQKLKGFFTNYRKYKYKGISRLVMVPAANLPVDPLGLTGVVGTTDLMDPRDVLNPIMFHGCHGEYMSQVIDQFYASHGTGASYGGTNPTSGYVSNSADYIENTFTNAINAMAPESHYYRLLTDPTWRKFGTQSGIKLRNLHPLTWKVARTIPQVPTAADPTVGVASGSATAEDAVTYPGTGLSYVPTVGVEPSDYPTTILPETRRAFFQEFTNGVARLGWLPTVSFGYGNESAVNLPQVGSITMLPKLFMGILVLPPSYNVEQFFRLSIRHEFLFKDFTASLGAIEMDPKAPGAPGSADYCGYYNWVDYTGDTAKVVKSSEYNEGTTLDVIGGNSEVVSDGVN